MHAHLVRHGEVDNPQHVVYADLPDFVLSAKGRAQADATGRYLASHPIGQIVCSPLERALETAKILAGRTAAPIATDDRLLEWQLSSRWAGTGWDDLPEVFPGELEAYLADPHDLPFAPESLAAVAARVAACVAEWSNHEGSQTVFVSHQDPLHSGRLLLTGAEPRQFHHNKPAHCSITSLRKNNTGWAVARYWYPDQ